MLKSSKLLPKLMKEINSIVQEIKNTSYYISVVGHTSSHEMTYDANYSNWELSVDRANSVRESLISSGLDSQRIASIIGKGGTNPLDFNSPEALRNRRIDIKLLKDKNEIGQHKKNTPSTFDAAPYMY